MERIARGACRVQGLAKTWRIRREHRTRLVLPPLITESILPVDLEGVEGRARNRGSAAHNCRAWESRPGRGGRNLCADKRKHDAKFSGERICMTNRAGQGRPTWQNTCDVTFHLPGNF